MLLRALSLAAISLTLAACNITGSSEKGPFKTGSAITASQLDNSATPISSTSINTVVDNDQGEFSVDQIPWNGWTELTVTGLYFDEYANTDSSNALTLKAITNKNRRFDTANINLFTHLAAARIKQRVADGQNRSRAWRATHREMRRFFGLTRVNSRINRGVDQLSLTEGTGRYRRDNANLLLFTGSFLASGGNATNLQALTDDFADDAQFNGVGETMFNSIAIVGNTDGLLEDLSQSLTNNGAIDPPNDNDLRQLPPWVNTNDIVLDEVAPVITLNGANPVEIEAGTTYNDEGATANDAVDGAVTVDVTNNVDTSLLGNYTVTYTAVDAAGNEATASRDVSVVDTTAPVIVLLGDNPQVIDADDSGATYIDLGATVTDNYDNDLEVSVDASGVNLAVVGDYSVIYTVEDSSGNEATPVVRTVSVIAPLPGPYRIIFNIETPDSNEPFIATVGFPEALIAEGVEFVTAIWDEDNNVVEGKPTFDLSQIDLTTPGSYVLTLSFTDEFDRTITRDMTVLVLDGFPLPAPE